VGKNVIFQSRSFAGKCVMFVPIPWTAIDIVQKFVPLQERKTGKVLHGGSY